MSEVIVDSVDVEVDNPHIIVTPDEIVVGDSGAFNMVQLGNVIDNSIGDIINTFTHTVTSTVTDNSSRITEIKTLTTGFKNELIEAFAQLQILRDVYSSDKEAYALELKTFRASFNESLATLTQELKAYANDKEAYARQLVAFKAQIDEASSTYLNQITSMTQRIDGGLLATNQSIESLSSSVDTKIGEVESSVNSSITNTKNTLTQSITKTKNDLTQTIQTAKADVREEMSVRIGEVGVSISDVRSILSSTTSTANSAYWKADQALDKAQSVSTWKALVEQVIKSPSGQVTGFDFGASGGSNNSNEKSHFNIYAKDINLVSNGKKIIGVKNGEPYIDGSVLRLDSSGDFYEYDVVVIPRTEFVQGDRFPHKYRHYFNLKRAGLYVVTYSKMASDTVVDEYMGVSQVGYVDKWHHAYAGISFMGWSGKMKFEIYKYGL